MEGIISKSHITLEKVKLLGEGTFAQVWKTKNHVVKIGKYYTYGVDSILLREASFLTHLSHPNILSLLDAGFDDHYFYLVLPEAKENLHQRIQNLFLTFNQICTVSYQLLSAVNYLHQQEILHGDLKPQNVLVFEKEGELKVQLADFGLAIHSFNDCTKTNTFFSLWYRAPELMLGENYTWTGDIWALGCIIYEMTMGRSLFTNKTEANLLTEQFKIVGRPSIESWPGIDHLFPNYNIFNFRPLGFKTGFEKLDDLLQQMLIITPKERKDCLYLLAHPIFSNFLPITHRFKENPVLIVKFKEERTNMVNLLYHYRKESSIRDEIISLALFLYDRVSIPENQKVVILSCLQLASISFDPIDDKIIDLLSESPIEYKELFIKINKQIINQLGLYLYFTTPVTLVTKDTTNRDLVLIYLDLLSFTSLSALYTSEFIYLLAVKLSCEYQDKVFLKTRELQSLGNVTEAENIIKELKDIPINYQNLNRDIFSARNIFLFLS